MSELVLHVCAAFVGLAGGLAVGSGFVAFITVLDLIPRLAQITRSFRKTASFEISVVSGVVAATLADFFDVRLSFYPTGAAVIGAFSGVFVGMLAAALAEVLNVFPILAKRLQLGHYLTWLLIAMVLGKVAGSLFDWIWYQKH
jgi:stage V sporulation protein AB